MPNKRQREKNMQHAQEAGGMGKPTATIMGNTPYGPSVAGQTKSNRRTSVPKSKISRLAGAGYSMLNSKAIGDGLGLTKTAKTIGNYGYKNLRNNIGGDWGDVASWAGRTAAKGAFAGGAIGGTVEAAQGGSFWAGAKEGAFKGAIGGVAYRGAGKAFADDSKNPINIAKGFGNSFGMISSTPANRTAAAAASSGAQRAQMSKSVRAIMQNQKDAKNVL